MLRKKRVKKKSLPQTLFRVPTLTHTAVVTMAKTIFTFTILTFLLFAVTTARIAIDPVALPGSDAVIPDEKPTSELDPTTANDRSPESEKTQTFVVKSIESTPRLIFSRSRSIHRHSFDKTTRFPLRFVRRNPCRKFKNTFMIPTKMSYGNDMMLSDKTVNVDLETLSDPIPTKWLEFKHKYGHHHHHFHHEEKKKEHKGGFMRRIRKFLKHTFD
ncbi:hypothetical protein QVD17_04313 [Tagetes erecta]|uniref:Uncharacterized protein n=1 Tax=Tagetes erecta TaxID=13708 RepID=A0AAD8LCX9_TARER|nr:hypothetical protein QVD17_04313 [Tagetes erecta]